MPPAHRVLHFFPFFFTNHSTTECLMKPMLTLRMTHSVLLEPFLARPGMDLDSNDPFSEFTLCSSWAGPACMKCIAAHNQKAIFTQPQQQQ